MTHPKNSIPPEAAQASPLAAYMPTAQLESLLRALEAERRLATKLWTGLNELRTRGELPNWIAEAGMGSYSQHDELSALRRGLDVLLLADSKRQRVEVSI